MRKRGSDPFVSLEGLEDLRERASYLGKYVFADALQVAMNEIADQGVEELSYRWAGAIEGGPTAFSDVRPGRRSNAVVAKKRRGATKGVAEASVAVKPKQSAFLKYQLGEADNRAAGDVGAAEKFNFIPVPDTLKQLRIRVTKQGNLPKNALSKLVDLVKGGKVGKQKQDRDAKGRFMPTAEGRRYGNVFFGKPVDNLRKRQKRRPGARPQGWGFWWRPNDRRDRLRPLAFAVKASRYPTQSLVPVWNAAMTEAGENLASVLRPIIEREIDRRYARNRATLGRAAAKKRESRAAGQYWKQQRIARELAEKGLTPEMVAAQKDAERRAKRAAYDRRRREARKARRRAS